MKIAIIQFPGSNCERETMLAVKRAGMEPVEVLWNSSVADLSQYSGFVIVGGFSYEDRSRAGIIAALDPIMDGLVVQSDLGKPILGICNGAQILVEKGLVPGLKSNRCGAALTDNIRVQNNQIQGSGYYNAWVSLRLSDNAQNAKCNAFTKYLKTDDVLSVPVAHGEGRFVIPADLLPIIQKNGQNVFQYCDDYGHVLNEFPINPNGSVDNIAALSNPSGNVLAMMPHPERTQSCDAIFQSMRDYICSAMKIRVEYLNYDPIQQTIPQYSDRKSKTSFDVLVDSILIDNHSMSVMSALRRRDMNVDIHRYTHWHIECDSDETFEQIKKSGVIFNDQKEYLLQQDDMKRNNADYFLIEPKFEMEGKKTQQLLEKHFQISGIKTIAKNILWKVSHNCEGDSQKMTDQILNSHILFNPYAYNCYKY